MSGQLLETGGGGPRCAICGAEAAGPCARCRAMVCADCCVLAEGSAAAWAVCTRCARRGGADLRSPWLGLLAWLGLVVLALAAVAALVVLAR